ncbi:putative membrane protein [Rhodococcus sp. SMB37]|nr:putative membrane protein [Rhodococcus sp. SMB37]
MPPRGPSAPYDRSMTDQQTETPPTTRPRTIARYLLAAALVFAGMSHLFWARKDFQAQVPDWVPMDKDGVVMASGGVEIMLGAGLAVLPRDRVRVGRIAALFFVAVFPGNLAQYLHRRSAFGLDTDRKRLIRLFFQPVLVLWALWSTGTPRR